MTLILALPRSNFLSPFLITILFAIAASILAIALLVISLSPCFATGFLIVITQSFKLNATTSTVLSLSSAVVSALAEESTPTGAVSVKFLDAFNNAESNSTLTLLGFPAATESSVTFFTYSSKEIADATFFCFSSLYTFSSLKNTFTSDLSISVVPYVKSFPGVVTFTTTSSATNALFLMVYAGAVRVVS